MKPGQNFKKKSQLQCGKQKQRPHWQIHCLRYIIVDKDGSVSNVRAQTHFGFGMEEEVIRVIEKSGKWNAAMQNGQPVKTYRKQPISFVLESDGFKIVTQEPYTLFATTDNEVTVMVKKLKAADISISVQRGKASLLSEAVLTFV
jgi:hypothetical protein